MADGDDDDGAPALRARVAALERELERANSRGTVQNHVIEQLRFSFTRTTFLEREVTRLNHLLDTRTHLETDVQSLRRQVRSLHRLLDEYSIGRPSDCDAFAGVASPGPAALLAALRPQTASDVELHLRRLPQHAVVAAWVKSVLAAPIDFNTAPIAVADGTVDAGGEKQRLLVGVVAALGIVGAAHSALVRELTSGRVRGPREAAAGGHAAMRLCRRSDDRRAATETVCSIVTLGPDTVLSCRAFALLGAAAAWADGVRAAADPSAICGRSVAAAAAFIAREGMISAGIATGAADEFRKMYAPLGAVLGIAFETAAFSDNDMCDLVAAVADCATRELQRLASAPALPAPPAPTPMSLAFSVSVSAPLLGWPWAAGVVRRVCAPYLAKSPSDTFPELREAMRDIAAWAVHSCNDVPAGGGYKRKAAQAHKPAAELTREQATRLTQVAMPT
eukprot:m51a1_g5143 hypothetical protein (450) ;mRNA; r:26078-27956